MGVAGPHAQGHATDWDKGMAFLPYWAPVKFVDGGQRAAEAKAIDKRFHCHLRHHVREQNPPHQFAAMLEAQKAEPLDKFRPDPEWSMARVRAEERRWMTKRHDLFFNRLKARVTKMPNGRFLLEDTSDAMKEHARAYFESFVDASFDQFAEHIDSVSEYNEYFSDSQDERERQRWINWATACVEVWRDEYRPRYPWIGLVLAETAVGNNIPWQVARLSHLNEWVHLGYHPYVPVWRKVIRPDAWRWYSGRWADMDRGYRELGYTRVTWLFGAVGHTRPPEGDKWFNALDPMAGWKHRDVYNGSISGYNAMILDWMNKAAQTPAWKEGRVIGATIFTSGGGELWKWFELSGSDIVKVCQFIGANNPGPPGTQPPEPPEPPEPPDTKGLINGYWGNRNWEDIPGTNKQRPYGWTFDFTQPGKWLPSGRKVVTTLSESVHKFVVPTPPDTKPTLPSHEGVDGVTEGHTWDNGRSGLVLQDPNTFKTFGTGTWHDNLSQVASFGKENANRLYRMTAYIDVHWHGYPPGNNPPEEEDIVARFKFGNQEEVWTSHDLPDRTWHKVEMEAKTDDEGYIDVAVDIEAYWAHPRTIWLGGFEVEPVSEPPPPEPPEVKCEAREPYNRTVWVLPGSATQEQWNKVAHDAKVHGRTITGSYDDAGIGCGLASRTAVLFGIAYEDRQTYKDWYNLHYTGTKVEFRALPVIIPIPKLGVFRKPLFEGKDHLVTQRFGDNYEVYMQRYGVPGHNGIDWETAVGENVYVAYPGKVLATGYDENGYGLFVTVQHEQGVRTRYAHLSDTSHLAQPGQVVEAGALIGMTGNSGWSSGPHLHFGVEVEGESVDPEAFLTPQK